GEHPVCTAMLDAEAPLGRALMQEETAEIRGVLRTAPRIAIWGTASPKINTGFQFSKRPAQNCLGERLLNAPQILVASAFCDPVILLRGAVADGRALGRGPERYGKK